MVLFMWSADVDANLTVRPTVMDQKMVVRNKRDAHPWRLQAELAVHLPMDLTLRHR